MAAAAEQLGAITPPGPDPAIAPGGTGIPAVAAAAAAAAALNRSPACPPC